MKAVWIVLIVRILGGCLVITLMARRNMERLRRRRIRQMSSSERHERLMMIAASTRAQRLERESRKPWFKR